MCFPIKHLHECVCFLIRLSWMWPWYGQRKIAVHGKPSLPTIQNRSTSNSRTGCALVPGKGPRFKEKRFLFHFQNCYNNINAHADNELCLHCTIMYNVLHVSISLSFIHASTSSWHFTFNFVILFDTCRSSGKHHKTTVRIFIHNFALIPPRAFENPCHLRHLRKHSRFFQMKSGWPG